MTVGVGKSERWPERGEEARLMKRGHLDDVAVLDAQHGDDGGSANRCFSTPAACQTSRDMIGT
jgi:hypothetical protein